MRKAEVYMHGARAGILEEIEKGKKYAFCYDENYSGEPVSLTMPVSEKQYEFDIFPPFFEGLLPEGVQLEGLLRIRKIDKDDWFSQLIAVGEDMVGAVTVKEVLEG
ncbi:MAG TPA: HipA N-terminal domain-containing protein [Candidatus Deferrimicrobium sp.]|nr:HipA N-terminal domain-containing protein [Candidatus Deferrimicrobium sp.]